MASGKLRPIVSADIESQDHPIIDHDDFRRAAIDIVRPAMIDDVRSMVRGRKWWIRASAVLETVGKVASAAGVILAFASGSDIATQEQSQILGFTAGAIGTSGIVLSGFANFARNQSIERGDALNTILTDAKLREIPDISDNLVVQSADS
jgi:hypothetical protein